MADDLQKRADEAQAALLDLLAEADQSIEARRTVALATQTALTLQALLVNASGHPGDGAKLMAQATKAGELAVKLEKSTLVDRVTALERALEQARRGGARVRQLARVRRE